MNRRFTAEPSDRKDLPLLPARLSRRHPLWVSLMCATMAAPGWAQESATAPAAEAAPAEAKKEKDKDKGDTETITVTATRRREPAREVPVQVQALPAEQLEKSGARSLSDYMANQPGVDVKTTGGAGLGSVSIRGVSTGDQTIATVGTYIDDVAFGSSSAFALGSTTALDLGLLDLHHIEVLRGPQGTLYGAGAMGGLLKYVTEQPDSYDWSGKVSLTGTTTQNGGPGGSLSAMVNAPLSEGVAGLRVSAFRSHDGGFVEGVGLAGGKDTNRGDTTGARASLLLEPSSRFHVRLSATGQQIKREGSDIVDYDPTTGEPVGGEFEHAMTVREPYSVKTGLVSAELEYDFGWARFNSISSAQRTRVKQRQDVSPIYVPALAGMLDLESVAIDVHADVDKETQEFRLTSQNSGGFEWLAGLYYAHETGDGGQNVVTAVPGGAPGPELAYTSLISSYVETALYGDVTWAASRDWSITLGARVARNRQHYEQGTGGLLLGGVDTVLGGRSSETSQTYLATARYALTPTSNVYFRAASGYRPGGPNAVAPPAAGDPTAPATFEHDSLWSYELGYKADLLDKKLYIESSIYDIRWDNLQQFYATGGFSVIVNAGKAQVQGAELSARYRASPEWTLDGSLSYVDAKLTEDAPGLAVSGSRLPNSARLSTSVGANYNFQLAGHPAYAGLNARYVGERNAGYEGSETLPNHKLPSYTMLDLRAGMEIDRYQLGLFVRNATDERAQSGASTALVPLGGPVQVTVATPRTFGLSFSASF